MTRETKIGLLVGLAFIIVIGILLSDHVNSSTDPVRAESTKIYDTVERSVSAPDTRSEGQTVVVAPAPVVPQNPLPIGHDQPSTPGVSIIRIQPGGDPSAVRIAPPPIVSTQNPAPQPPPDANVQVSPPAGNGEVASSETGNTAAGAAVPETLRKLANANGEDLVPAGGPTANGPRNTSPHTTSPAGTGAAAYRQIKAEEGDTVSKLAAKYLGANNKATREAIIKANPSMTVDGHLVFAGHTYLIPLAAAAPVAPQAPERQQPAPPSAAPTKFTYYTVKENDKLWRIAAEQLGSGTRWTEIRDLNPDVLKGGEQLQVGMRLKLPPRAVASSN